MGFKSGMRAGLWWTCVVAFLVVSPFFWRGTSNGHDLTFHVDSWIEVAHAWKIGTLYPHWAASANFGTGEPRFVFYPPISWTIGALLALLLPISATPGALSFLVCVVSSISMFFLAREWLDEPTAVVSSVLYSVNPYLLVVIYERGAFAEMIAAVWFPLLLLFALREGSMLRNVLPLSLTVAAIWLTNLPAAVIASYLLAFVVILRAWRLRRWEPIARAALAMVLGLTLAGFYLIPAVYEQRWVQISQAVSSGASPSDNFLFAHTGDAEHDVVLLHTSVLALLEVVFFVAFALGAKFIRTRTKSFYDILLAIAALAVFLMTSASVLLWKHAPKLMYVQFPWRWLIVLSLALTVLAGITLARTRSTRLALFALVPILIAACYWNFQQTIYPEDRPAALLEAINTGEGYEGTDEYTPIQADNSKAQPNLPRIAIQLVRRDDDSKNADPGGLAHSESQLWQPERKRFSIDARVATHDTLRLLDYPAWKVTVDGRPYAHQPDETDGRMTLDMAGGHHDVAVDYQRTPDNTWGDSVSAVAFFVFLALGFIARRRVA